MMGRMHRLSGSWSRLFAVCLVAGVFFCAGPTEAFAGSCGDGVQEGGEECDPGGAKTINGVPGGTPCSSGGNCFFVNSGGCCKFNCQFVGQGAPCDDRNACSTGEKCNNVGMCECSGSCDPTAAVGSVCRASTGECDPAEICLENVGCPADSKSANGTACADDGNPCTQDKCDGGSAACQHPAGNAGAVCRASAGECDPVETCTGNSTTCPAQQPPTGTPCTDDGNVCTSDVCDANSTCTHPNNTASCSDGLFCNGADSCSGGSCSVHAGSPCASLGECNNGTCNEAADNCAVSAGTICSSDGNVCTTDQCNGSGSCVHTNNSVSCNDGLACNGSDTCSGGSCSVHAGDPCAGGSECNNTCAPDGSCHSPLGTSCSDDGNVCTSDQCDGNGTCAHIPNTAPCNDGLYCNGTDVCGGGTCGHSGDPCSGGPECNNVCNETADNCAVTAGTACSSDGNICTDDQCNGSGACGHPANTAPCDDGLFCNGSADTCSGGTCSAHVGDPCLEGSECANSCNELANNCFDAEATACTDDGNVCTDDQCDGAGACAHPNNTDPCDDALFCNGEDTCAGGACGHDGDPCLGGAECANACNESADNCFNANGTSCTDDGNVCTDDTCNGSGTCAHPNNTASCDDGLYCNVNEVCAGGACGGGEPRDCSDPSSDICTTDSCNEASDACVNTADPGKDGVACNDHDACTTATTCLNGACINGTPVNCDDSSDCTVDSCDSETGCVNVTTVEDRTCNSCLDGVDNDTDEQTDADDPACATLSEAQHFSVIGKTNKGISLFLGSQVSSLSADGSVPNSSDPFPLGASRGGVCGESKIQIYTSNQIAGPVAAAAGQKIVFGGGQDINFGEVYVDAPDTTRILTGVLPVVGPGNCSVGGAACTLDHDCAPPASTCEGLHLDSGNPNVDHTGLHEEFVRCSVGKAALSGDEAYIYNLPATTLPTINHKVDSPQPLAVFSGPGPHIVRVPKVRVAAQATLLISGDADSVVVIQVEKGIAVGKGGHIQVAGGLKAENLLWVGHAKGSVSINGGASFDGTVLAPDRKIRVGQNVTINGSLLGDKVKIHGGVILTHLPFTSYL